MRFSVITVFLLISSFKYALTLPVSHSSLTRPNEHGTHSLDEVFSQDIERREPKMRAKATPKALKGRALGKAVKKEMRSMKLPHTSTEYHINGGRKNYTFSVNILLIFLQRRIPEVKFVMQLKNSPKQT
jgi:hypothetical protein